MATSPFCQGYLSPEDVALHPRICPKEMDNLHLKEMLLQHMKKKRVLMEDVLSTKNISIEMAKKMCADIQFSPVDQLAKNLQATDDVDPEYVKKIFYEMGKNIVMMMQNISNQKF